MLNSKLKSQLAEDVSLTDLESPRTDAARNQPEIVRDLEIDHEHDGFQELQVSLERPSETEIETAHAAQPAPSKSFDPFGLGQYQRGSTVFDRVINYLADLLRRLDISFFKSQKKNQEKKRVVVVSNNEETEAHYLAPTSKKKKRGWFGFIR